MNTIRIEKKADHNTQVFIDGEIETLMKMVLTTMQGKTQHVAIFLGATFNYLMTLGISSDELKQLYENYKS